MAVRNATHSAIAGAAAGASDRELVFTRTFDAPRELVFTAWTDPQHVAQWWGPRGFRTTIHEMDVRPGGVWRLVMHGPDGVDYNNRIVFVEVTKPERLVYKHDPEKGSEPVTFQVTVTFTEEGGQTKLTMHMRFPSAAAREHVVKKYGAIDGATQTLDRLREHLMTAGKTSASKSDPARRELVMTRTFDAPREVVFEAWTDPERVKQWWGPKDFTNPVCEMDVRPGGSMRIHMRGPDGVVYPMTGVYNEVVAPERLVFTSGALGPDGQALFEVLTVLTFSGEGAKTNLTLRATVLSATPQAVPHLAGMEEGWSQSLDRLAAEVRA